MPQITVSHFGLLTMAILLLSENFISPTHGVMIKFRDTNSPTNSSRITFTAPSSIDEPLKMTSVENNKVKAAASTCRSKSCKAENRNGKKSSKSKKKGASSKKEKFLEVKPSLVDESEYVYQDSPKQNFFPEDMQTAASENLLQQKEFEMENNEFESVSLKADDAGLPEVRENEEDWKVRPRLIAVKVNAAPPRVDLRNSSNPISSMYSKYPTIRLADFARKIIFPQWIWTRFNQPPINKKSEFGTDSSNDNHEEPAAARPAHLLNYNDTFVPTTTTRRPKGVLERPTITFDNNMSRFLRLFTVVRFQNVPCVGPSGENGTCYHGKECSDLGGLGTTPCAQGLGVCCLFFKTCGETVNRNGTYFVSTGASFSRGVSTCNLNIQKISPTIRQIRLDLHTFIMLPPNAGSCESDRFLVSGQNTNNIIPILCGNNSGSHLYIETGTSQSLIQLSVMTTGEGLRAWSIQINQIEEAYSMFSAPSHCLQYHEGAMGTITSFNYESSLSPQYLNNLNYNICIRKEAGFCSITYSNLVPDGQYYPFQIVNADAQGNLLLPSGQAGLGLRNCPDDYILLNGIRLCGERLNDLSKSTVPMEDAPVTDITNGPFTVTVRTNDIDVGGGFSIYYRQNPCMSTAG